LGKLLGNLLSNVHSHYNDTNVNGTVIDSGAGVDLGGKGRQDPEGARQARDGLHAE
jgi:hypothetical protein